MAIPRITSLVVVVALAAAAFASIPAAHGGVGDEGTCSRTYQRPPKGNLGPGPAPLLIGDSVTAFTMPTMQRAGFRINAQGCRDFAGGIKALKAEARKRKLPNAVVFELGTVGNTTKAQIAKVLRLIGKDRKLVLVTPRVFGGGIDQDAKDYHAAAERDPRITVVEWAERGEQHPEWFWPDLVHPDKKGGKILAKMMVEAVR